MRPINNNVIIRKATIADSERIATYLLLVM